MEMDKLDALMGALDAVLDRMMDREIQYLATGIWA